MGRKGREAGRSTCPLYCFSALAFTPSAFIKPAGMWPSPVVSGEKHGNPKASDGPEGVRNMSPQNMLL